MKFFVKFMQIILRTGLAIAGVIGGLTLGLSALTGAHQTVRPPHPQIAEQRQALHDRVQRVRSTLKMNQELAKKLQGYSRLAQWYNFNNWPNGLWNNFLNR
jgi:hypothetical protein